jgi:hypothetical protein
MPKYVLFAGLNLVLAFFVYAIAYNKPLFAIIIGILNDEFRDCMRSPNVCPSKLGSRLARRYTKKDTDFSIDIFRWFIEYSVVIFTA